MANTQLQTANTVSDILDIDSQTPTPLKLAEGEKLPIDYDKIKDDAEYARANIREAIDTARISIKEVFELAKMSQDARAFRVLKELIEAQVVANKSLLDTAEVAIRIKETEVGNTASTTINNNLVLSTTDFLKMIDAAKERK